jgi:hypothetical protein
LVAFGSGLGLAFCDIGTIVAEVCAGDHKMQSVTRTFGSDLERTVDIFTATEKQRRAGIRVRETQRIETEHRRTESIVSIPMRRYENEKSSHYQETFDEAEFPNPHLKSRRVDEENRKK